MMSAYAFILALSTAVLFSAYGLLARYSMLRGSHPLAFAVWVNLFASLFAVPIMLFEGGTFREVGMAVLAVTVLSTIFSGIFEAIQFFARRQLEASRSTVLFQLTPLVTFAGSVALLGESINASKLSGALLIISGNLLAAYNHGGKLNRSGVLLALSAAFALGCVYIADKFASSHYPIGFYVLLSYFLPALYVATFAMRGDRLTELKHEILHSRWRSAPLALTSVLGYYFILKAFRVAEASTVMPIVFASTIFTAFGGIIFLRERSNIWQKIAGAALVFGGVVLLR